MSYLEQLYNFFLLVVHRDGIEYDGAETDSYVEAPKPIEYDTSKIDPLDIDAWRRLVEGEFEKVDYALHGGKYVSILNYDCCVHRSAILYSSLLI